MNVEPGQRVQQASRPAAAAVDVFARIRAAIVAGNLAKEKAAEADNSALRNAI